ncbi:MAG: extracellular solute-binding protein [Vicinamibacteria bacterium]|nr:extracellular solute-binding protein [Vicinamibacteria bacterium]
MRASEIVFGALLIAGYLSSAACRSQRTVVIYTSVDQPVAEPILKLFEERTGIRALAVYDIEAAKTTGLVQRLAAERARPRADVFWSSEIVQTIWLKHQGALAAHDSAAAGDIPAVWRDPQRFWTAFGLRGRILLINTRRIGAQGAPASIDDLARGAIAPERIGLADPLFGTSATHAAFLCATRGIDRTRAYYASLQRRGVRFLNGNSVVRDLVASGELDFGLTDTDDATAAVKSGAPVRIVFPDQGRGGALFIPNTVALIANAPHPATARALIDFLVSSEVEQRLITAGFIHSSVRAESQAADVDWEGVTRQMEPARAMLRELLVR